MGLFLMVHYGMIADLSRNRKRNDRVINDVHSCRSTAPPFWDEDLAPFSIRFISVEPRSLVIL